MKMKKITVAAITIPRPTRRQHVPAKVRHLPDTLSARRVLYFLFKNRQASFDELLAQVNLSPASLMSELKKLHNKQLIQIPASHFEQAEAIRLTQRAVRLMHDLVGGSQLAVAL